MTELRTRVEKSRFATPRVLLLAGRMGRTEKRKKDCDSCQLLGLVVGLIFLLDAHILTDKAHANQQVDRQVQLQSDDSCREVQVERLDASPLVWPSGAGMVRYQVRMARPWGKSIKGRTCEHHKLINKSNCGPKVLDREYRLR